MRKLKRFSIGCVIGTRPEVIKMAPIIFKLKESSWSDVFLINTAQHRNLLDEMLLMFGLKPDADLNSMIVNQSLGELTSNLSKKLDLLLKKNRIDALLAVGDTTTVLVSALIAFYHQIPFGHIEAGLRTYNSKEPFPEEINRVLTAPLATWHFVPTAVEKTNLLRENIAASKIFITGNPVIDALYWVLENKPKSEYLSELENIIVVTAHRRENFGENLKNICLAIIELSARFKEVNFLLPVHPNPHVQNEIFSFLSNKPRIHLLQPLKYDEFAHLMNRSLFILTDSGGVQEEAPALRKPILVLRNTTERPAVIEEGLGLLVGTNKENIIKAVSQLLIDEKMYSTMARGDSPYGDGHAAEKIVSCLEQHFL